MELVVDKMKNKLVLILALGVVVGSFVGCSSIKDEIVVKEDVTTETSEGNEKLSVEKFDVPKELNLQFDATKDGVFYAYNTTAYENKHKVVYKLTEKNTIEYVDDVKDYRNNMIARINNNTNMCEGIDYWDFEEKKLKPLVTFAEPKSAINTGIDTRMINDKIGFYSIEKFTEKSIVSRIGIVDVKTLENLECNAEFDGNIVEVILYDKEFYVFSEEGIVYQMKEENNELIINKTIDLSKVFNLGEVEECYLSSVNLNGDEITLEIGVYQVQYGIKSEPVEDGVRRINNNMIIKYNAKTKEKQYIDMNDNKIVKAIKNDMVILEEWNDGKEKKRYYLGEIKDGRILLLDEFEYELEKGEKVSGIHFLFNDNADEFIATAYVIKIGFFVDEHHNDFYRVKINK